MTSSDPTSQSSTAVDSEEAAIHEKALAKGNSDQSTEQSTEAQNPNNGFWPVFLSTFVTIFLAELGDKTQVTTMLMSAESKAPVVVFLGAGLALISTSLIGVLLGQWLSNRVSEETLDVCAGILLILISIGLVGDIFGG